MKDDVTRKGELPRLRQVVARVTAGSREWTIGPEQPRFKLGRAKWNDFVLDDEFVSRDHGHVEYRAGKLYLNDGSTNGTYVVRPGGRTVFVRQEAILLEGQGRIRPGRWDGRELAFIIKELAQDGKSWVTQCAPQAPEPFVPVGNVFKKEGEYWTITYEGAVVRMKDAKGLRYLAHLLRHPDQEFHVLDLVAEADAGAGAGAAGGAAAAEGLSVSRGGGAGPILDATAKAQYRRRLRELREELEEAERFNDTGRAEHAQGEIEALTRALTEAVGLGGRDREAVSNVERARVMVTLRIRDTLKKMRESRPPLGHHLDNAVKTGRYCAYSPDPAHVVSWVF